MFIDTHTHLYLKQFDADRGEMVQRAEEAGIDRFYLPNIDHTSIEAMLEMESAYPGKCFAMMGLHPCSVKADYKKELKIVEEWLFRRNFCAVGEIGIDLHWDKTYIEEQKDAFVQQIRWAKELEKPIVIHSRETTGMIIDIVEKEKDDRLTGIFHCFSGTVDQAERIMQMDFYLGIGGVVTFKRSGLDKTLESLPLERIVLETDAPYLAPVPYRGKRNESAYIRLIAEKVGKVKNVGVEEVGRQTSLNAIKLFENK